jgi:hypothetical protein
MWISLFTKTNDSHGFLDFVRKIISCDAKDNVIQDFVSNSQNLLLLRFNFRFCCAASRLTVWPHSLILMSVQQDVATWSVRKASPAARMPGRATPFHPWNLWGTIMPGFRINDPPSKLSPVISQRRTVKIGTPWVTYVPAEEENFKICGNRRYSLKWLWVLLFWM